MFNKTNILKKVDSYIVLLRAYVLSLRDVRNVGLLVFTVIVLLISWSGVKSIQTNYGLQKQISQLQQEDQVQSLKNSDLALQNEYFNTNQYLEVTARENLGLGAPGETELLVPQSVALAHTVKQPSDISAPSEVPKQPFWQRNFESWINFFLNRDTQVN
jgi:cell division protein FtsB